MGKPTTGKYTYKKHRCTGCGIVKDIGTNHWGDCYPYCYNCRTQTIWECLEEMPEEYEKPAPWKLVKLGDICEIKRGVKIK